MRARTLVRVSHFHQAAAALLLTVRRREAFGQKKAAASAAEEMKVGAIGMCTTFE